MTDFVPFPKIARLNRDIIITEKIDGTNAAIGVGEDGTVWAQSRSRIITPKDDNFGFAKYVEEHADELRDYLGPGLHFGEWWGRGIQRGYDLDIKRFSLFNTSRWGDGAVRKDGGVVFPPNGVGVVPVLYEGIFKQFEVEIALYRLETRGSRAAPGFMRPEGVVIYHTAARQMFKVTLVGDESPKGEQS